MAWIKCDTIKSSGGGGGGFDLLAAASGNTGFDLKDSVVQSSATKIPQYMFRENSNIQEVNMANITDVGTNAFYGCTGIMKVYLPACTHIGSQAFYNTGNNGKYSSGLIYLPECLTIDAEAFRNFKRQAQLMITLTKCTTIGNNAFRGGTTTIALTQKLELPAIQTIGQYAFGEHTIPTVEIGSTCTYLNIQPFYNGTITDLIVRAVTPPNMASNLGCTPTHIYVPDESVSAYQSDSKWGAYSSIIEGISNYNP
jgi:hypothetical protein